jgi:hypothetical protein
MKIVPINNASHRMLKVRESHSFSHAASHHMAILAACEIMSASMNYPLVFAKHPDTGRFRCLALFGLKSGENLFFDKDGWKATYIPMNISRTPFAMCESGKGDDAMLICIDEDSPYVSNIEGAALFDDRGGQTEFLDNVVSSLSDMAVHERHTQQFVKTLVNMRLLVPISVVMTEAEGGDTELMEATYTVSEVRLRELPDAQLLELHKANYLGLLYSLINSLELINRLVALRNTTTDRQITNVQVSYLR